MYSSVVSKMFLRVSLVAVIALITVHGTEVTKPYPGMANTESDTKDVSEGSQSKPPVDNGSVTNASDRSQSKPPVDNGSVRNTTACKQSIDNGQCFANFAYWGYDHQLKACVKFHYGGCDGNDNRFVTPEECKEACIKPR